MKDVKEYVETSVSRILRENGIGPVLVGISGGADSVALAVALCRLGVSFECAHCNFRLRGDESERDRIFVERLCAENGWPLTVLTFDVGSYRREHGVSVEMACRELRYAEFFRLMTERGLDRVAVAHNSDDNAETLLLNLFRGAGVSGLRGMKADTGRVVRPLLNVDRSHIELYLGTLGFGYVTDSTNLESDYKRNFIRNELLPLIETRWPSVRRSLCSTAAIMAREEKALGELERILIPDYTILGYDSLRTSADAEWLIRRFAASHGASNETAAEIYSAYESASAAGRSLSGRHWVAPGGSLVFSPHGLEWVSVAREATDCRGDFEITEFSNSPQLMDLIKSDRGNSTLWLPVDPDQCVFRHRRDGDRIRPLGMKGSRLVSDVVSDARLTAAGRNRLCIVESGADGEIIWVEGLKRSRKYLIRPENATVYRVRRRSE